MADLKFGFHYSRLEKVIPPQEFGPMAEEMGFDSVWVPEALVNEVPAGDILMTMSALVHNTSKIKVGAGAVLLPLRNPVVLAKELATLDVYSKGRVIVGYGVGGPPDSHPDAFEACGISLRERGGPHRRSTADHDKVVDRGASRPPRQIPELFQHTARAEASPAASSAAVGRRGIGENVEESG